MEPAITGKGRTGVTWRAIIIGLLLIPVNSYWIFMMESVRYQGHPTSISLFYNCVFNLVILILINSLLRRTVPKWVLTQIELITIYVMINLGSALVGHDSLQILVPVMCYANYFATTENRWGSLFADRLPDWLVVKDPVAAKGFFQGGNFFDPVNYGPWIVPVLWWSAFIITLLGMFLCINVLLRKQWTERERLSYPLVQLPIDMTADGAPLFKEKLLWYGLAIAVLIDAINGLAVLYPSIPTLPIKMGGQEMLFTTRPWNNIGWLPVQFYPFGIGLGMLLPVDLLFSCWFFFWFWKAENILTAALGLDSIPNMPFVNEQSFGAYMGICIFALAVSRKHFAELGRHFLGMSSTVDDRGEPIPYRVAMWLILIGMAFLMFFAKRAGMSTGVVVAFFLIYFAMCIAITRMRAELGPPAHDLHVAGPDTIIANVVGPRELGTENLNGLSLMFWFNRAYRSHPMPFQLEGFKMAERTGLSYRGLFGAMALAGVVGTFVGFFVILHLCYHFGAASSNMSRVTVNFGSEPWNRMDGWVKVPQASQTDRALAITAGFAFTMLLNWLRMRVGWFPFHPVGFAVSSSWAMHLLWAPMFIAWITKLVILRYGGLKLYRKALPFFLGIILGECLMGSLWNLWGLAFHLPSYSIWP